METDVPLFPEQASTVAAEVDALYFFLVGVSTFFTLLIGLLILYFAIKYRRGSGADRTQGDGSTLWMEMVWIFVPLAITVVIFFWGTTTYFRIQRAPENAMEIHVVGKQWMWKFKHPQGQREINVLHVPVNQPIVLKMISEDVIHDLFVPAFRVKNDVRPGSHSTVWFEATRTGTYHLFCAEYCGTKHSQMVGSVVVMEPAEYEEWLAGGGTGLPPAESGGQLFTELGCATCHGLGNQQARGPNLAGSFGEPVTLVDGMQVIRDDDYLRRSIVQPQAQIVAGFDKELRMPSYAGRVSEEQLMDLIAYIKTLETAPSAGAPGAGAGASDPAETAPGNKNDPADDPAPTESTPDSATKANN